MRNRMAGLKSSRHPICAARTAWNCDLAEGPDVFALNHTQSGHHDRAERMSAFGGKADIGRTYLRRYVGLLFQLAKPQRKGNCVSTNDTYLAVFRGSKTSPKMMAWNSLPEAERRAKEREGMAAWKAWVEKHQSAIVAMGGPLGKTKKITQRGIEDISNDIGAFTVVRAESNEAAAKLFENHPHFTIFPGEAVEVMPVLPIPGA